MQGAQQFKQNKRGFGKLALNADKQIGHDAINKWIFILTLRIFEA